MPRLLTSCCPCPLLLGIPPTLLSLVSVPQNSEHFGAPVIEGDGEIEFKVDGWLPAHAEGSPVKERKGEMGVSWWIIAR